MSTKAANATGEVSVPATDHESVQNSSWGGRALQYLQEKMQAAGSIICAKSQFYLEEVVPQKTKTGEISAIEIRGHCSQTDALLFSHNLRIYNTIDIYVPGNRKPVMQPRVAQRDSSGRSFQLVVTEPKKTN